MNIFMRGMAWSALVLSGLAAAHAAPPANKLFSNNPGLKSTAKGPPGNRVVLVSKEIGEFIYWIGAENQLIARDLTTVYPPQILKKTSIGYHRALSADGIISLHPSVFLTDGNFGPPAVAQQLQMVGVPIKVIRPGKGIAGAEQQLLEVGRYFGREARAEAVIAQWKANMAKVMAASKLWANRPKPRVVMVHFGQAENVFLAVTGGTAAQIMQWAGGNNVMAGAAKMERLTPELMADAQPDVIVANQLAFSRFGSARAFTKMPGVALTPAAKNLRIYEIKQGKVIYFGPRTPAAIMQLAQYFHPNVFKAHPELVALYHQLLKEQP